MAQVRVTDVSEFVKVAKPEATENSLLEVAKRIRQRKRWLDKGHLYNEVISALKNDEIDERKIGEYIACSAPLHLADGWGYLSRAFESILRGDRFVAYHLAYYAELRAAMSLLATEGVGVFRDRHIALDANLRATESVASTHQAVWSILSAWALEPDRSAVLLSDILLESDNLSGWLELVGTSHGSRKKLTENWLAAWSIDIKILSEDSSRRNEVSYRPTRMHMPTPVNPREEIVRPLLNSWELLRPSGTVGGAAIDTALFREALKIIGRKRSDKYLENLRPKMPATLHQALTDVASNAAQSARSVFDHARDSKSKTTPPILARSLLMLRLASARTASLLKAGNVKGDLKFWWMPLGTDLGLWDGNADLDSFADLWADVESDAEEAEERLEQLNHESVHSVSSLLSKGYSLTQFSRVPLWLLGIEPS